MSLQSGRWCGAIGGGAQSKGVFFSVKSTYTLVSNLLTERRMVTLDQELAFKVIWKCPAPSKVSGLVWMVLHDKVPTRDNLVRRGIITENGGQHGCVFCGNQSETVQHLFLYCTYADLGESICLAGFAINVASQHFVFVKLCSDNPRYKTV
jgi:hypothetical protein